MPTIVYVEHDQTEHRIEVDVGASVMQGAVENGVPGIDGDCGGQCACATCHVYVDPDWLERVGIPAEHEEGMLDTLLNRCPNSRLACQISVDDSIDGLVVSLPSAQH